MVLIFLKQMVYFYPGYDSVFMVAPPMDCIYPQESIFIITNHCGSSSTIFLCTFDLNILNQGSGVNYTELLVIRYIDVIKVDGVSYLATCQTTQQMTSCMYVCMMSFVVCAAFTAQVADLQQWRHH